METWNKFKNWVNNNAAVNALIASDSFIPTVFVGFVLALILKPAIILISAGIPALVWVINSVLKKS